MKENYCSHCGSRLKRAISLEELPSEARDQLVDGLIPSLTLSGGTLSEFGGKDAILVYRVWVKEEGTEISYMEYNPSEFEEALIFAKDTEGAEPVIAVVWDEKKERFREVAADSLGQMSKEENFS